MSEQQSSSTGNVTLTLIATVCVIGAASGGGLTAFSIELPHMDWPSRVLLAIAGVAIYAAELFQENKLTVRRPAWHLTSALKAGIVIIVIAGLVGWGVKSDAISFVHYNPAPLTPNTLPLICPVRDDTRTARSPNQYWILLGTKLTDSSDALDLNRNIVERCIPRAGETATILRDTSVFQGVDPAKTVNGAPSISITDKALRPSMTVRVTGELSGIKTFDQAGVSSGYQVWAPVSL